MAYYSHSRIYPFPSNGNPVQAVNMLLGKEVDVNLGMPGQSSLGAASVEGHGEVIEFTEEHEAIKTREALGSLTFRRRLTLKNSDVDVKTVARVNTLQEEQYEEPDTDKGFDTEGDKSPLDPEPYVLLSLDDKVGS